MSGWFLTILLVLVAVSLPFAYVVSKEKKEWIDANCVPVTEVYARSGTKLMPIVFCEGVVL